MCKQKKQYSIDDVQKLEDGRYKINYINPETDKTTAISGNYPERIVNTANQWETGIFNKIEATEPYIKAIKELSTMALNHSGSGAKTAAQVLLSAWNGNNYQLDVSDLCNLDQNNYTLAMAIFNGRVHTMREPHSMIEDGDKVFQKLAACWPSIHIKNRWRKTCYKCYGSGEEEIYEEETDKHLETKECWNCDGTGYDSLVPEVFK